MKSRDETTGLPSRNNFLLALELAASDARQRFDALSLLSLVIAPGATGAPVPPIVALANVVLLAVGATGLVASAGSERLFVMLKGRDLAQARDAAKRLSGVVQRHFDHRVPPLIVGIGVACAPADGDWAAHDLVSLAEARAAAGLQHDRGPLVESASPTLARWPSLPAVTVPTPPRLGQQLELF